MFLRRQSGPVSLAVCLFTLASAAALRPAFAQTQIPSLPAATPADPSSLPSMPAATPIPAPQQPAQQPNKPAYQDPLTQPIVVAPGAAQPVQITQPLNATLPAQSGIPALPAYDFEEAYPKPDRLGSAYIPVDSPIYPMALRLYSLGYLDTAFISMRPWTRRSLLHMLQKSQPDIVGDNNDEAMELLAKLNQYIIDEAPGAKLRRGSVYGVESVYTRLMGIGGQTLRDSYHLGQTLKNDYGRPYQPGFNSLVGFSSLNEKGPFSLYVRGEYQHAPQGQGYSLALASYLSVVTDQIDFTTHQKQDTIPYGPIAAQDPFRLVEATLSAHVFGHEISGGKSDAWLGPGLGGAMAWSNNAENIYSFRINRVEPLHIPLLSSVLGNLRYDFMVGSLKGHTVPNSPWVHTEMFEFAPTTNLQIGFQRTVIWGGHGHEPITIHSFLRSFFNFNDTTDAIKHSTQDPGARFSAFNFSYRLPFVRKYLTLYTDSEAHDDVTPPSAPRRAAYRPGLYLSQFPHLPKLDLRVEAVSTDGSTKIFMNGSANYFETVQVQGYTNKGFIFGDWIGREAKGGQAWLTYHLSGNEWIQLQYLNKKTPKDFVPQGTTQNQFTIDVMKRFHKDFEVNAWLQYERWKAPAYLAGQQSSTTFAFEAKWFPKLRTSPVGVK